MSRYSPTRDGFRAMFQRPSVGVAEVLWRWSFGAALCLLLVLCFAQYLQSLPVSKAQLFLIGSGQAVLALKALQQILAGSSIRLIRASFVLAVGAAMLAAPLCLDLIILHDFHDMPPVTRAAGHPPPASFAITIARGGAADNRRAY